MTTFILSHNLQVQSEGVPAFTNQELAEGLKSCSSSISSSEAINHPHWIIKITSSLSHSELAVELVKAWKAYRTKLGHQITIQFWPWVKKILMPCPMRLQKDFWGVDVVETADKSAFPAINGECQSISRSIMFLIHL